MPEPVTISLPDDPQAIAPDGTAVRLLPALAGGSMAHFTLAAGATSLAVRHRTVEEIWYFLSGAGELWRAYEGGETIEPVEAGASLTIPLGAAFQCRAAPGASLVFLAITMPPWPGEGEAIIVEGPWPASV
jgi:mannose-6-phosphate isomerase-like protein (cupin superfamily)